MRQRPLYSLQATWLFAAIACGAGSARSQERATVPRVTDVEVQFLMSQPPGITVTATGEVPSRGFTDIRLERVHFAVPPADGYQAYQLSAKPPNGPAAPQVVAVSASDSWPFFEREAPWLRGVRVLGEGPGIHETRINRRVRRNIRSFNSEEIDAFRKGVAAMKARPASDPTSWTFQANIHWAASGNNPLFNQCQHGTQHFLTWHRLYLYHFEQILAEAAGDPDLTLPYWDWTTDRALPLIFRQPANRSNSLFDDSRFINQGALLPLAIVRDDLSTANSQTSFLGQLGFSRQLEASPHGAVHVAIGGNMSSVATAARDPIFWMHHCNIDRLWDEWLNSGQGRNNPTSSGFLNQTFSFVAADGTTVIERVGDNLFTREMGYSYDTTMPPVLPATAVLLADAVHHSAHHGPPMVNEDAGHEENIGIGYETIASTRRLGETGVESPTGVETAEASEPLSLQPHRARLTTTQEASHRLAHVAGAAAPTGQVVVQVKGVEFEQSPAFTYAVYLNLPENVNDPERMALYRLGTLDLFGLPKAVQNRERTNEDHASHELSQTFDATATISGLKRLGLWNEEKLEVVLLPLVSAAPPEQAEDYQRRLKQSADEAKVRYQEIAILSR